MKLPNVGLSGKVGWELSERGAVVASGECSNLITDSGLDQVGTVGVDPYYSSNRYNCAIRDFCAVGTGQSAPAFTDTALGNEVARVSNSNYNAGARVGNGVFDYIVEHTFLENQANGNLTEVGYSSTVGGPLSIRTLFKDGNGNPIVLTKTNTQQLKITHTLKVTIGPVVVTPFTIPFTGDLTSRTGTCVLTPNNNLVVPSTDGDQRGVMPMLRGIPPIFGVGESPVAISYGMADANGIGGNYSKGMTANAYTGGSYKRTFTATLEPAEANGFLHAVYALKYSKFNGYEAPFFVMNLDAGQTITKDNLHRLTLSNITLSWGRQ